MRSKKDNNQATKPVPTSSSYSYSYEVPASISRLQIEKSRSNLGQRERWLAVIGYEVWMLGETYKMPLVVQAPLLYAQSAQNAFSESRLLHTRNLCDFCMPRGRYENDIKPEDLFDDYSNIRYDKLRDLVIGVKEAYTNNALEVVLPNGNTESQSPKWAFDKMLAHPTKDRGLHFDYEPFIGLVYPKIKLLADEIRRLEKEQGRDFPSLPDTP